MEPIDPLVERVLRDALGAPRGNSTQTVVVRDEGKSNRAWNAFYLMLGLNAALLAMFVMHDRKIERMQDHLNAIYMMAPHLKPEKP